LKVKKKKMFLFMYHFRLFLTSSFIDLTLEDFFSLFYEIRIPFSIKYATIMFFVVVVVVENLTFE